jgi:hypothetical protein
MSGSKNSSLEDLRIFMTDIKRELTWANAKLSRFQEHCMVLRSYITRLDDVFYSLSKGIEVLAEGGLRAGILAKERERIEEIRKIPY